MEASSSSKSGAGMGEMITSKPLDPKLNHKRKTDAERISAAVGNLPALSSSIPSTPSKKSNVPNVSWETLDDQVKQDFLSKFFETCCEVFDLCSKMPKDVSLRSECMRILPKIVEAGLTANLLPKRIFRAMFSLVLALDPEDPLKEELSNFICQ